MTERLCSVEGCGKPHWGKGLCQACYTYQRRHDTTERSARPASKGYIDRHGYRRIYATGHPLATPAGRVLEHRRVAYDKYGPGNHPCHWCGRLLSWREAKVDHLDGRRLNNVPENLVIACGSCNSQRANAGNPIDFRPRRLA